jgi:hypothetical protein
MDHISAMNSVVCLSTPPNRKWKMEREVSREMHCPTPNKNKINVRLGQIKMLERDNFSRGDQLAIFFTGFCVPPRRIGKDRRKVTRHGPAQERRAQGVTWN